MKDLFGKALLDYQNGNYSEDIVTSTNISDEDVLPLPYLFREFNDMPKLEQKALKLSKDSVLDVGCGSGSHSIYLQKQGFKVKAIDISKGAIEVAKQRGVHHTEVISLLDETETFDTIEIEVELSSMNSCVLEKMDTDLLSFSEAFGYFRQCLGSDSSFQWKGLEYTTLLSEEVIINVADSVHVEENTKDTEISQIR